MQHFAQFTEEEIEVKLMGLDGVTQSGTSVDDMLKTFINRSAEAFMTGECSGMLGILTGSGERQSMIVAPYHMPWAKYRFARCISNVARKVAAHRVFITTDCYIKDEAGNRIGEMLTGVAWNSDGTGRGCSIVYTRENGTVNLQEPSEVRELKAGDFVIRWDDKRDGLAELGLAAAGD